MLDTIADWQILVYDTGDNLQCVCTEVESAEFTFERLGGCGQFSITLPDSTDQDAYFQEEYKLVLQVKDPDTGTWSTWFAGQILSGTVYTKTPSPQVIRGMGFVRILEKRQVNILSGKKDYSDVPVQANFLIYGSWQQWLKDRSPIVNALTDFEASSTIKYPAMQDRSFAAMCNSVVSQIDPQYTNGLGCTWGVNELQQLFAKPVPAATVVEMEASDPRIDDLSIKWDATDKVNAVFIDGGDAVYPNLLANPSFADAYSVTNPDDGVTHHYRFFGRINSIIDTPCGWCLYPGTSFAIYHYDFFIDGYSQGGVTYSDRIIPIHDNNLVYFDGSTYSGSKALWSNKVRIDPFYQDDGDTAWAGTLAFGAIGRYYSGAGTVMKVSVHCGKDYGTELSCRLSSSHPDVYCSPSAPYYATVTWGSGDDFDLKKVLLEFTRANPWDADYYWFRIRVAVITNNRPLWADNFFLTKGRLETDHGVPAEALLRMQDTAYQTYLSDIPAGGYAVEGQLSSPFTVGYADAKRNFDMFMDGAGGTKVGGSVSLANYPYRIVPWEGAFIVRNIPDKRNGGVRSDIVFPMESSTLRIGKDGRFGWGITLGDRLPDEWQYIAQGWAKTNAAAATLKARMKKQIIPQGGSSSP